MNTTTDSQDAVNARVYHHADIEQKYRARTLMRFEAAAMLKYQPAFAQKDVLDIGVGTGRTSIYLAPLARRYEGVDYSPVMIRGMRAAMPEVSVRLADMRDLSDFEDASFDFVFAPNNVIDAVGHDDRLRVLREFHRLLRAAGMLMFSSHNRQYEDALGGPKLELSLNPIHELVLVVDWLRQMANHQRVKRLRVFEADYALLNDEGHGYACLHYYIGQTQQRQQLAAQGYEVLDVFDHEGHSLALDAAATRSAQLMYVTRRAELH